jgi:hypothetical protein
MQASIETEGGPFESADNYNTYIDEDLDLPPEESSLKDCMHIMNFLESQYTALKTVMNTCDCNSQEMVIQAQNLTLCLNLVMPKL